MKAKSLLAGAVLLVAAAVAPLAAEQVTLDVEAAVRLARENNLAVESARIDLRTLERERNASWNEVLPAFGVGASLTHLQSVTSEGLTSDAPWSLSASVSTSLSLSNSIRYSIRATELEYEAGLTSLAQTVGQLERDVRKSFYELLLKLENIRLLEDSQQTARKRLEQVTNSYEHGLASQLDRLNAQVNLENVKPRLQKAQTDYETATMQFKFTLGLDQGTKLVLEGEIGIQGLELDAERLARTYGPRGFEVVSLTDELAILENSRKLAAAQELQPALSLSYSFRAGQSEPFSAAGWTGPGYSGTSSLGVSLSLPLDGQIPSSASQIRLAGIDDSIRKNHLALTAARARGAITIESLVLNLQRSAVAIEVLQKNAALAERVYQLTQQEYEAGLTDLLTLEQSYADLEQARVDVLTEQYNYRSQLLDLEYELNTDLEG